MSPTTLHEDLETGVRELRGALTALLGSVGSDPPDPRRPQEVSRRLGVDKSLAWKVSRVIAADGPREALPYVPGTAAISILVKAAAKAGGPEPLCRRVESAMKGFREAVRDHLGDRGTLELVVDALPGEGGERLLASRKLAFRGNSAIWGVQARARFNAVILTPNAADTTMIDVTRIGGWRGFRRLRDHARWTLMHRRSYDVNDVSRRDEEPLDPPPDGPGGGGGGGGLMLLRDFCSDPLPPMDLSDEGGTAVYELGPGPIGRDGAFDLFFGSTARALGSRFATQPGETADFGCTISAPCEAAQTDLIVHRDCGLAAEPTAALYAHLGVAGHGRHERDRLPIEPQRVELGRYPPVVDSPLDVDYTRLIAHALERLGWAADAFAATRFVMDYPPFPSTLVTRVALEPR